MKALHILLSALIMPALFISPQLKAAEVLNEEAEFDFEAQNLNAATKAAVAPSAIVASFRSNRDQSITAGENVAFHIVDINIGKPVKYDAIKKRFTILKEGFYLLHYGVFTTDPNFVGGINLVLIREGIARVKHRSLISDSPSAIIHLKVNDKIQLVAQKLLLLNHGSTSTNATDTAFIQFIRLDKE